MMLYRLNLYEDGKLTSTELLEVSLQEAKEKVSAALDGGQAHKAELMNPAGSIIFRRSV
jgi:hypothetical protein